MKKVAVVEVMDCEGDIFGSSFLFDTKSDQPEDLIDLCFQDLVDWVSFRFVDLFVPSSAQLARPAGLRGFDYDFTFSFPPSPRPLLY